MFCDTVVFPLYRIIKGKVTVNMFAKMQRQFFFVHLLKETLDVLAGWNLTHGDTLAALIFHCDIAFMS